MNPQHGKHERELYRTYLADLVSAVVILWGGDDSKRSSLPVVLLILASSFCFWGSLVGYLVYIWFIK